MSETERIIVNVNATMAMEGLPLTEADELRIANCPEFDCCIEITEYNFDNTN